MFIPIGQGYGSLLWRRAITYALVELTVGDELTINKDGTKDGNIQCNDIKVRTTKSSGQRSPILSLNARQLTSHEFMPEKNAANNFKRRRRIIRPARRGPVPRACREVRCS
jgi:hypothetical protein